VRSIRPGLALAALLAAWIAVAWPHVSEQLDSSAKARAGLAGLSWEDRAAAVDSPGYQAARHIAGAVPPGGCVLVLAHTGPEHLRYYGTRFAYYLYPRRLRFSDHSDAAWEGCQHLAVFRDTAANLAQETFQDHWDEGQLQQRTGSLTKILSGGQVEIFRVR